MPLSTSNSNPPDSELQQRSIPQQHWLRLGLISAALGLLSIIVWESYIRSLAYVPSYNDTDLLWAAERDRAVGNSCVIIGSSRARFDINLDVWEQHNGTRPIQLARNGSCPIPIFMDLAYDPSFNGTMIVSVTPSLFFMPPGMAPVTQTEAAIKRRAQRGPSDYTDHQLAMFLEQYLACLQDDDLSLAAYRKRIPIDNRAGSGIAPRLPPMLCTIDADRGEHMLERLESDSLFQDQVKQIWRPLMRPPPFIQIPPAVPAPFLEALSHACDALRQRGGKIIFIRPPSAGEYRSSENELWPRQTWFDQVVQACAADAIHFEDHDRLQHFTCPEWSHLTRADARLFTQALLEIIKL